MIQRLDLGPETRLRPLATATDGVQYVPARSHVGLDVLPHIGNDDPQDAPFFQATTAFRKQARAVAGRFEMLEIVLDMYSATRPIAQGQIATAIGPPAHSRGREQVEIDPAVLTERTATDINEQAFPARQGAAPHDPAGMDVAKQSHHGRVQLHANGTKGPGIDRQPRYEPCAQPLLHCLQAGPPSRRAKASATIRSSAFFSTFQL